MSTELYIPPTPRPKPTRCPKTGRFLPGHVPTNKGKTWGDYMTKRAQRRAAKGWKNCEIGHAYGRKQVIRHDCWRADITIIDQRGYNRVRRRFKDRNEAMSFMQQFK